MSDGMARVIRTVLQLIAAGALYQITDQLAKDVPATYAPYVLSGYALLVVIAQNAVEGATGHGILRKPGVPPNVDAVDEKAGAR